MRSFKRSGNIQNKQGRQDRFISNNQFPLLTLNEKGMKASDPEYQYRIYEGVSKSSCTNVISFKWQRILNQAFVMC